MPAAKSPATTLNTTWLDRFRSPTEPIASIPYLDGIRAIAVVMIFLRHAWGHSGSPALEFPVPFMGSTPFAPFMTMFSSGVDLFFVLSGFLLARSFILADFQGRSSPKKSRYFMQRLLRIGPPYWITLCLVLFLFTPHLIRPEAVYSKNGFIVFLAHLVFGQTVYMPAFGSYGLETPFWTLTIEVLFYALLPFVVPLFFRRRWMFAVPVTGLLSIAWLLACRYRFDGLVDFLLDHSLFGGFTPQFARFFLSHTFPSHMMHFAIGIAVCNIVIRREIGWENTKLFLLLTSNRAGLLYMTAAFIWIPYWMHRHGLSSLTHGWTDPLRYMNSESYAAREYYFLEGLPFAFGYGLLMLGASLGPVWPRRFFGASWLGFIGVIGYSVYLLHMPILYHLNTLPWLQALVQPHEHFAALAGYAGLATILLSTGFFIAVERPAMLAAKNTRGLRN